MTNREVARIFNTLGKVMELHGENPFKTRSYTNAYLTIRKMPEPVFDLPIDSLQEIKGIGKAISEKILELKETGELRTLNKYLTITPPGIAEMLNIKGFGPKKIRVVWKELDITSPGELLYACTENRLVDLKGFGEKTQEQLRKQLSYYLESQGKFLYGHILPDAIEILALLQEALPDAIIDFTGDLDRKMPVVNGLVFLSTAEASDVAIQFTNHNEVKVQNDGFTYRDIPFSIQYCSEEDFARIKFEQSCSPAFLDAWIDRFGDPYIDADEEDLFDQLDIAFIPSECRELPRIIDLAENHGLALIDEPDIKGMIHAHSTYSDGMNTLKAMAEAAKGQGYEYMLISDHSKSAFYADGLNEDHLIQQWREIDELNAQMDDFVIFKGIESDILNDGSLDYPEDVLAEFDCIIASIHSNLKMDIDKAMARLIRAIENPYTRILGHPTGRLLLSREGYPIDHMKIIDACIANDVVIEINANPHRLDIDWRWIDYIMSKDGMVSINPDAHSIEGIADVRWGVIAARKGGLMPEYCLNTYALSDFKSWL